MWLERGIEVTACKWRGGLPGVCNLSEVRQCVEKHYDLEEDRDLSFSFQTYKFSYLLNLLEPIGVSD